MIVAHVFTSDERMTPRKLAGVLLGFGGVATMIGPDLLSTSATTCLPSSPASPRALLCARRRLGAPLPPHGRVADLGDHRPADRRRPDDAAARLLVDQPWTQPFPPLTAIGAIIALALLCTAFGYVLYFRLIDHAGATNALLVTLLVPPVAILLGALFLGEQLDAAATSSGSALIALGLAAIDGRLLSLLRTAPASASSLAASSRVQSRSPT